MSEPTIITKLRAVDNGTSDSDLDDFSTSALLRAQDWAIRNDGNLLVLIEDELDFRTAGEELL
jgi:hypothetical protein